VRWCGTRGTAHQMPTLRTTRYDTYLPIRLSRTLLERAQKAAAVREQRTSELVRDALRAHLAQLEREEQ